MWTTHCLFFTIALICPVRTILAVMRATESNLILRWWLLSVLSSLSATFLTSELDSHYLLGLPAKSTAAFLFQRPWWKSSGTELHQTMAVEAVVSGLTTDKSLFTSSSHVIVRCHYLSFLNNSHQGYFFPPTSLSPYRNFLWKEPILLLPSQTLPYTVSPGLSLRGHGMVTLSLPL